MHHITNETTNEWLQAFAHQGVHELELLLAKHAAFHHYVTTNRQDHNNEEEPGITGRSL